MEYITLHQSEGWGSLGGFGIKILVAATNLPDLKADRIRAAAFSAASIVEEAIQSEIIALDPRSKRQSEEERASLISLFDEPIFVEEIPNGYCSSWCCKHLPWFVVTTKVGHFKIGWRKRVIHLEWSDTVVTKRASELFPTESTTKGDRYIHCWGIEKAKEYINAIMDSIPRERGGEKNVDR